jgi:hypothetical protein
MAGGGDDRYEALGQVVELAAVMEISLRLAFCVLVGGPYAAVVAGGQEAHWLIDTCDVVVRRHLELTQPQRDAIHLALRACRDASHDRNRLVHDAWAADADGVPVNVSSETRSYQVAGRPWTAAGIGLVAGAIGLAQRALLTSVEQAFGSGSLTRAQQLLEADTRQRRP